MNRLYITTAFAVIAALTAPSVSANDDTCIRVQQVRAFAPMNDNTLIVRQGPEQFRKVTVSDGCPVQTADRIAFAIGSRQQYLIGRGSERIAVNRSGALRRICEESRHAYVSFIDNREDDRPRCQIESIEISDRNEFEAQAVIRDNRY